LVLLRAAISATLLAWAMSSLADWRHLGFGMLGAHLLVITSGISLLIGYLTPLSSVIAGLLIVSSNLPWFRTPSHQFFDTRLESFLTACIAGALACLGPGAFSVDAHAFGRREINIPD
jgi:uncharacterized membrane protein YphA (DoxX/SURF4 family)